MSQYLSSIFIDPIVRQARRFSRPSNDNEPPDGSIIRHHTISGTQSNHDALVAAATVHESQIHLVLEDVEPPLATADDLEDSRPPSSRGLETEAQPWGPGEDTPTSSQHLQHGPEAFIRTTSSRSYSYRPDDETSDNPLYGIPESFRSRDSSFSNSTISGNESAEPSAEVSTQASRLGRNQSSGSYSSRAGGRSLPADDGKSYMRKKILAIQGSNISSNEKARLIHELMTENYTLSQSNLLATRHIRALSPSSLLSQEHPCPSPSVQSIDDPIQAQPPTTSHLTSQTNPFHLSPGDLITTYHSKPENFSETGGIRNFGSLDSLEEQPALGCPHYKRNVKLQCSACERWYTCRFCHDEVEDHSLIRRATKNMLCMLCGHAQAAAGECQGCGKPAARYYCDVCKLWDDDPQKSIYHCDDCGICRVGQGLGKDFFHCVVCCACVSMAIKESHRCIERSTECDCPICGEYMFNSPRTVVFMRCGHSIHQRCYYEHMNTSYRCPICSRSVVNMDVQFRHLEREIECQPMPPQFRDTKVRVYCNDCSAKTTVKYHWLGLKCAVCDSFNTAQIQILQDPEVILPPSRGRALEVSERPLRPAVSASALGGNRISLHTYSPRNARSESPSTTNRLLSSSSSGSTSDPADSMDTDEEYEDVEFWGGESLSNRARPLPPYSGMGRHETGRPRNHDRDRDRDRSPEEDDGDESGANDYDDDDDDDEQDDDEDEDNNDDDDASTSDDIEGDWDADGDGDGDEEEEEEEEEEGDPMDIFGHR